MLRAARSAVVEAYGHVMMLLILTVRHARAARTFAKTQRRLQRPCRR